MPTNTALNCIYTFLNRGVSITFMKLRPDLAEIPVYIPGKRLDDALKLSSNEVPQPPLPAAIQAMADAAAGVNRYPDMGVVAVREALAQYLALTPEHIAVGVGSSALCLQLAQITSGPGDEIVFPWRSFEAYPIFTKIAGATPVQVPLDEHHRLDLPAIAAAVTDKTRLIFICNPNNPTGTTITEADFIEFMHQVPSDVVVALDEAYFEYVRDEQSPIATKLVHQFDNLVGLRTFSKAFGLAGTRIGYAFGNPDLMVALNKVGIPFGVNAVAQAGALASLEHIDELLARTDEVVEQRIRAAAHIGAVPSESNFIWYPCDDAPARTQALLDKGVIIRGFPDGIRITITTKEETDRLLEVWDSLY